MNNRLNKITAFTLAEVLITLLIIGVIAAMTIPVLYTKINKLIVEVKLKQDYSILQQAMQKANADVPFYLVYGNSDNFTLMKEWIQMYLLPYMKIEKICYETKGCWHTKGHSYNLDGKISLNSRIGVGIGSPIIAMRLTNGTNICFDQFHIYTFIHFGVKNGGMIMFIDANGDSPPNIVGKDIYAAVFTDKGIVPAGNDVSKEVINKNCDKAEATAYGNNAGWMCLKKVQQNGWQISDEVWNKK